MKPAFFVKEAFRSISRNAIPSFAAMASVLVTLLVLGVFIPVVQATTGAANEVRGRVLVNVFMQSDSTPEQAAAVKGKIAEAAGDMIKKTEFVSKEQAYRTERKRFPELYALLGRNPLGDTY